MKIIIDDKGLEKSFNSLKKRIAEIEESQKEEKEED